MLGFFGCLSLSLKIAVDRSVIANGAGVWSMLQRSTDSRSVDTTPAWGAEENRAPGFSSLTLPLTVGPGGCLSTVTLGASPRVSDIQHSLTATSRDSAASPSWPFPCISRIDSPTTSSAGSATGTVILLASLAFILMAMASRSCAAASARDFALFIARALSTYHEGLPLFLGR